MDLNRGDLIKEIAEETGYTVSDLTRVFRVFEDIVIKHIKNLDSVKIMNGVKLRGRMSKERNISHRFNGKVETVVSPEHVMPDAVFSEWFRSVVRSKNHDVDDVQ